MKNILFILLIKFLMSDIPDYRIVAEWEPALGTMIRWPLGIPQDLVVELSNENIIYVLVETGFQQNQATNSFNNWGINPNNIVFIPTDTYSHWTRDHGPQFLIGMQHWEIVNQQFNGYPVETGCTVECDDSMVLFDCTGTEFCNNQPGYQNYGYDCYINNDTCEDYNNDGQILDWLGDGYCDDGDWGLNFMCDEYSWDCGDCGYTISDENGYCDNSLLLANRKRLSGRPIATHTRGWEEDDDTNIDFANEMNWDLLDIPFYWTGGNFMTDGYGQGFSTNLMINENNMDENEFKNIAEDYLNINNYHIFDNPNQESIQHIDCIAKLVNPETIIIKQVPETSPEYECIEEFAASFNELTTFYDRPFIIHRVFCPEINGGAWETNPVAAYTNSLILNNKVLVPQYGVLADEQAIETYQEAMPGYDVIGFDGAVNNPWYSEDALHCRTMGIFDPEMMHISHRSIRTEELTHNSEIYLSAEIIDYGADNTQELSVWISWKYESENIFNTFSVSPISDNEYLGVFPLLNPNSRIEYFISASNEFGRVISHPIAGWHTFSTLEAVLGDVDGNNQINIIDIIIVINIILEIQLPMNNADINQDGEINIIDIIDIINLILNN